MSRALAIDDNQADAHAGMAAIYLFHDWDWAAAERASRRAYELGSALPMYAFWLSAHGRLPEALAALKRGQELDPQAVPRRAELAVCYISMREPDQAINEAQKALELDPNFAGAYREIGRAYIQKRMPEEAVAMLQKALKLVPGEPFFRGDRGCTYVAAGREPDARNEIDGLKSQLSFKCPGAIARIHAALGEKDEAFNWLQKACDERDPQVIFLKTDPSWDNLRSDPRFDAILQHMGLADKAAAQKDQPLDTLAVLPFDNQSPDPEAGYLGDDITYSLTDSLARVRELKVRPYSSAARFKAGSSDAMAAGRELQVQAVLHGSIQKRGEEVMIDVELIRG
jgi:TolB-like protein